MSELERYYLIAAQAMQQFEQRQLINLTHQLIRETNDANRIQ